MLELGRRNDARITPARVVAATIGALVGWGVNRWLDLNLIRLIVPEVAPHDLAEALAVACLVGALSGALCSVTGTLIYRVRAWNAGTTTKLLIGGASLAACFAAISALASPSAAVGPGAGAVTWAEGATTSGWTLLLVAALRAAATTAAVAAGGCGGLFVPFLAVGDLCGRALAPGLGTSADLAAASGSAGAIAGGYRLPITAFAMVIAIGGPAGARLTCLLAVAVAAGAGVLAAYALDRLVAARIKTPTDDGRRSRQRFICAPAGFEPATFCLRRQTLYPLSYGGSGRSTAYPTVCRGHKADVRAAFWTLPDRARRVCQIPCHEPASDPVDGHQPDRLDRVRTRIRG